MSTLKEIVDRIHVELFLKREWFVPDTLKDKIEMYINKEGKLAIRKVTENELTRPR